MLSKYFRIGYPLLRWRGATRERRPIFLSAFVTELLTNGGGTTKRKGASIEAYEFPKCEY